MSTGRFSIWSAAWRSEPLPKAPRVARWREIVIRVGKGADDFGRDSLAVIRSWAAPLPRSARLSSIRTRLRLASISRQVAGDRHRCVADHRAAGGHDRDRHRATRAWRSCALRRRRPHHQPRRGVGAARDGRAHHRDHGGRALGIGVHGGDRRDEGARGDRRARSRWAWTRWMCWWCRG